MNLSATRVQPSPFLQDVVLTTVTTGITMLSLVLVTRWLAQGLGPDGFGAYGLSRRIVTAVTMFSPVGLALARYLATDRSPPRRGAYLAGALGVVAVACALVLAIGLVAGDFWTARLFHDGAYRALWDATVMLIVATALYTVLFAWYRGIGQMRKANLWQLWAIGVGPMLVAAAFAGKGRADLIVLLNAALAGAAVGPLVVLVGGALKGSEARRQLRPRLSELLSYGVPRVPGNIAFGGLLAVGPLLAPHFAGLREAGYLVIGQSVLRVVEGGTGAFGLVALARLTELHSEQRTAYIREGVEDLLAMSLHLGLFLTCQLLLWSDVLVGVWLGSGYDAALPLVRVTVLAVVPYLAYTLLRSILDAVDERAVNSSNILVAFGVTVVLALGMGAAGLGAWGLSLAGSLGFLVLGALTVRSVNRTLACRLRGVRPALTVLANLVLLSALWAVKRALGDHWPPGSLLLFALGLEALAFAGYVLLLRRSGVNWVRQVEARLLAPRLDR
jgi:O-antigen/teichoic acid export membrane protein